MSHKATSEDMADNREDWWAESQHAGESQLGRTQAGAGRKPGLKERGTKGQMLRALETFARLSDSARIQKINGGAGNKDMALSGYPTMGHFTSSVPAGRTRRGSQAMQVPPAMQVIAAGCAATAAQEA